MNNVLVKGLMWPVISVLLIGGTHFIGEIVRPEMAALITSAVLMPLHLAAGGWAGYRTVQFGGTYVHGIVAGAILGLLPVGLQLVGFGLILARDGATVTTAAVFGFLSMTWGGMLGAGLAQGRSEAAG